MGGFVFHKLHKRGMFEYAIVFFRTICESDHTLHEVLK